MMDVNQTPPDRMTGAQRRQEVAQLLARGIARLRMPVCNTQEIRAVESEFELAIPLERSVHSVSNLSRKREMP